MVIFFPFAWLVQRTTQVVLTEQGCVNPAIRCKDLERPHREGTSGIFEIVCKSLCCTQLHSLKPPHVKRTMRYRAISEIMKEKRIKKMIFFFMSSLFKPLFQLPFKTSKTQLLTLPRVVSLNYSILCHF